MDKREAKQIIEKRKNLRKELEKKDKDANIRNITYYKEFELINKTFQYSGFSEEEVFLVDKQIGEGKNKKIIHFKERISMEKSTTYGMLLGLFAVGYGMYLKGADPHALINPAAFLIIFAGTFAALLNAFPMKDIKRFGKLLKIICQIILCLVVKKKII